MNNRKFSGTGVAVVTPFKQNGDIDFPALERLVEHLVSNHVDYLVFLGTTAETATLTPTERTAIVDFARNAVRGRLPIMLGIGGNDTRTLVQQIREMDFQGIDGILSVTPGYNKPSQKGLLSHYAALAEAAPVGIMLYNVPSRTSVNLQADTVAELARRHENIIGIKEASGDLGQVMQILKNKPKKFMVISGDDALAMPMIALGARGVISVIANVLPSEYSDMVRHALEGHLDMARQYHFEMLDLIQALFAEGNPAGIKAALAKVGILEPHLRLPLTPISPELDLRIKGLLKAFLHPKMEML